MICGGLFKECVVGDIKCDITTLGRFAAPVVGWLFFFSRCGGTVSERTNELCYVTTRQKKKDECINSVAGNISIFSSLQDNIIMIDVFGIFASSRASNNLKLTFLPLVVILPLLFVVAFFDSLHVVISFLTSFERWISSICHFASSF